MRSEHSAHQEEQQAIVRHTWPQTNVILGTHGGHLPLAGTLGSS